MKKIFLIPAFVALFGSAVFASDGGKKDNGTTVSYAVNNKFESNIFMEFDIISWLRSKIENRKFIDILREKRQSTSGPL